MSTLPPDTPNKYTAAQKPADALSHQERVYFEMFRAIEQLGRKLEKAEAERYLLARRLGDIEASAEKDEATGRYYLPAKIEPALAPPPHRLSGMAKGSIAASLVFALLALGVVVAQDMPQKSGAQQIAAIDTLLKQGGDTVTAARSEWHRPVPAGAALDDITLSDTTEAAALAEVAPAAAAVDADVTAALPAEALVQAEQPPALSVETSEQTSYLREAAAADPMEEDTEDFNEHLAEALGDLHVAPAQDAAIEADTAAADMAEIVTAEAGEAYTVAAEPEVSEITEVAEAPADEKPLEKPAIAEVVVAEVPAVPPVMAAPPKASEKQPAKIAAVENKPVAQKSAPLQPATLNTGLPRVSRDESLPPALMAMQERAFEGVAEAQHDLAAIYAEGRRVPQNYTRARAWFGWAAAAGVANAHYNLAVMDQQGLGAPANMPAALGHYIKAADLGHPEAMYNLGLYYTDKRSDGYNAASGVAYFKRAANAGMTQAAYNLGVIYESDMLGKQDIQSAQEWYGVAANDGNAEAERAVHRLARIKRAAVQ